MPDDGKCIVRCLACAKIPMILAGNDGNRSVPRGGILLVRYLASDPPTVFRHRRRAEQAILRTLAHSNTYGYGWKGDDYAIQSLASLQAEVAAQRERARKRQQSARSKTHTDGD